MEAVQVSEGGAQESAPAPVTEDTGSSLEVGGEAVVEAPKKAAPVQKFKLTIDGKSVEATEAEIESMWRAAAEGRTHAEKSRLMEEQVRQFMERGRNSPEFLFEQLGIDPDAFAEQRVLAKLKEMQMTPEQREAEALKKRLAEYEEKEKKQKEVEEKTKADALAKEAEQVVDNVIAKVIESAGTTPSPRHIARVAEHLIAMLQDPAVELNQETATKAFQKFQLDLRKEVKELAETLKDDELIDMLGEARFNKLLKYDLQKVKKNVPDFAPKGLGVSEEHKAAKKPLTFDDFIAAKLKK